MMDILQGSEYAKILTTEYLARPLAATKFEIRMSKYETNSNDKKPNAPNFT